MFLISDIGPEIPYAGLSERFGTDVPGLLTVQEIVTALKGTLDVKSTEQGAHVSVVFPKPV